MSTTDTRSKRLNPQEARKLIAKIVHEAPFNILYSGHALKEAKRDNLTTVDIFNILKSPDSKILSQPEFENGSYRYRLETKKIMVVVSFISPNSFAVVTTWRKKT